MKRIFPFLLALIFALMPGALAESEAAPLLGGTKIWPEFRGMQFGLSSAAVIYREADAGTPIVCHRNGNTAIDVSEALTARAYPVVTSEPIDVLGRGAYLRYEFQGGQFTKATLYWPMSNDKEAREWVAAVRAEAEAVFGAPDQNTGADGLAAYSGWDLGKLFSFSEDGPETYEGSLGVYIKNIEPETLEAAVGLQAGKPAVVLHIARVFYPQASGSYLSE